jgi:hypothetical protein
MHYVICCWESKFFNTGVDDAHAGLSLLGFRLHAGLSLLDFRLHAGLSLLHVRFHTQGTKLRI